MIVPKRMKYAASSHVGWPPLRPASSSQSKFHHGRTTAPATAAATKAQQVNVNGSRTVTGAAFGLPGPPVGPPVGPLVGGGPVTYREPRTYHVASSTAEPRPARMPSPSRRSPPPEPNTVHSWATQTSPATASASPAHSRRRTGWRSPKRTQRAMKTGAVNWNSSPMPTGSRLIVTKYSSGTLKTPITP